MTLRKPSLCDACKRLRRDYDKGPVCAAFPEGIPEPILVGGFDHRNPFPGDHGVRFVRDPDVPLPEGFPEEPPGGNAITVGRPPSKVRHQSERELRENAKAMIEQFRGHAGVNVGRGVIGDPRRRKGPAQD